MPSPQTSVKDETPQQQQADQPQLNPLSCEVCRRRKTKCDRRLPTCTHCSEARVPCHYPQARQRGPQIGYLSILEGRLIATEVALYEVLSKLHSLEEPGTSTEELIARLQGKYTDMPYSAKTAEWQEQPLTGDFNQQRWLHERRHVLTAQSPVAARRSNSNQLSSPARSRVVAAADDRHGSINRRPSGYKSMHVDTGDRTEAAPHNINNDGSAITDTSPTSSGQAWRSPQQERPMQLDPELAALSEQQLRKYF